VQTARTIVASINSKQWQLIYCSNIATLCPDKWGAIEGNRSSAPTHVNITTTHRLRTPASKNIKEQKHDYNNELEQLRNCSILAINTPRVKRKCLFPQTKMFLPTVNRLNLNVNLASCRVVLMRWQSFDCVFKTGFIRNTWTSSNWRANIESLEVFGHLLPVTYLIYLFDHAW